MSGGDALWPPDHTADPGLAYEIRESLAESSEALFLKEEPIELEFAKAAENGKIMLTTTAIMLSNVSKVLTAISWRLKKN